MAILEIVRAPDPRLKASTKPVTEFDGKLKRFMDDMLETMKDAKGIGLAANQVGILTRVAVIDLDPGGAKSKPYYLVNPRIVETSKEQSTYNEGCLSVPDIYDDVHRPARLTVQYEDEHGKTQTLAADGLLATCLQHEIDHLNGMLFLDHLSRLKRSMALRKSAKQKRLEE